MNLLGTHIPPQNSFDMEEETLVDLTAVPTSFDGRTQWPSCIHAVRDQGSCGSCWAFGSSEALSDRFCVASNGAVNVILSPEDLVSCDKWNYGCNGGYLNLAWSYLTNTGVVSDDCFPYGAYSGTAPSCQSKCSNGAAFKKYKCKSGSVVHPTTISAIKQELATNGPLEGAFTVYEDFFNYQSGVYYHVSGSVAGGHAIKVLGYGTEGGLDYWLCANSWGTSWGEQGFFKIKQGDSDINNSMYGCTPDLTTAMF